MAKRGRKNDSSLIRAFFAYPSEPKDRSEIIESAIKIVNQKQKSIFLFSWATMDRQSSRLITSILEEIRRAEYFIADISGLNYNVLFEAGFAFANQKKVILFTQGYSKNERDQDFRDLQLLSSLLIREYQNANELSDEIINGFKQTEPEMNKYGPSLQPVAGLKGFLLKGFTNHEIALSAQNSFSGQFDTVITDDWNENPDQILRWYLKEVATSTGLLSIFISESWDSGKRVNARFSLVCGMGVALEKRVLMIGLPGFKMPFDYKDILIYPTTATFARNYVEQFFLNSTVYCPTLQELLPQANIEVNNVLSKDEKEIVLLDINLGNSIAENEEIQLPEYFIKTGQFVKASNSSQAIMVGSKGCGKTANFFLLREHFKEHPKNIVCEIKPADYRMERFLSSLKGLERDRGFESHIIENVWKAIVYAEIVKEISNNLKKRPIAAGFTNIEQQFLKFYDGHSFIIEQNFENRLESMAALIEESGYSSDIFSELVHNQFLSEAKKVLVPMLRQYKSIFILIDNLDKAWSISSDLNLQSKMVLNALGIQRRLNSDLFIDVAAVIFIRKNIFEYILNYCSREPDKLIADSIELVWDDNEMLNRVLEKRFTIAIERNYGVKSRDLWESFFCRSVEGIPTKQWIYENIMPRPRDLIDFIEKAIEWGINRGHSEIEEGDFISARVRYSDFALDQVIAEYNAEEPWLSETLRSFTAGQAYYTYSELREHVVMVEPTIEIDTTITKLVKIGFLGVCLDSSKCEFATNMQNLKALVAIVKNPGMRHRIVFKINKVFHYHLRIDEQDIVLKQKDLKIEQIASASEVDNGDRKSIGILKKVIGRFF